MTVSIAAVSLEIAAIFIRQTLPVNADAFGIALDETGYINGFGQIVAYPRIDSLKMVDRNLCALVYLSVREPLSFACRFKFLTDLFQSHSFGSPETSALSLTKAATGRVAFASIVTHLC